MSEVSLTVHRSAHTIGGNCIELSTSEGARLILDVGRPLDTPKDADGLLPGTLKLDGAVDGVLISHPHQDHFGLLGGIPSHWPVYCGEATAKLMTITADIMGKHIGTKLGSWYSGRPMVIGAFTVTPYLIDHSAFDAYMLLIDIAISMKAKTMVPVHGTAWDSGTEGFPHISRLTDGQPLVVCSPKP